MSLAPVPIPLPTIAVDQVNHEYENFILEDAVENVPFAHWTAHLRSFWGWYSEGPDYSCAAADLPRLQQVIARGLETAGYPLVARDIYAATSEVAINDAIFAQYTDETSLYQTVNKLLRSAHGGATLRGHPLVPWILQLNSALRLRPEFDGTAYRGANMGHSDIEQYQPGLTFVWAAFVSASQDRETALDYRGNVLFDITPWGSYSMYGKRNSFDIAKCSAFPGEREVVFPTACTYRVIGVRTEGRRTLISLQSVDQY